MAGSKNRRNLAVIGAGVGVATAGVITLLVLKKPADEETTDLSARAAALPAVPDRQLEGGVVKPWEAKQPTPEELKQAAADDKAQAEETAAEEKKAEAALRVAIRQDAIDRARNAGVLGGRQGGAFASLTGTGDVSSGFDDANIYGGLLGNEAGEMNGGFGYGRAGYGPGGGGTGWGTIGTGRYGTIGHGSGQGTGYGVGGGRGGMRGAAKSGPTVRIGQPNANGDLDKAIIRRYIKRNIQKIQYCYEKELIAKPNLKGTVNSSFTISPNGTVDNASAAGIDPNVSSCIAGVIKGIEFPKPKNGGSVTVNYPFTFTPADAP